MERKIKYPNKKEDSVEECDHNGLGYSQREVVAVFAIHFKWALPPPLEMPPLAVGPPVCREASCPCGFLPSDAAPEDSRQGTALQQTLGCLAGCTRVVVRYFVFGSL